jgi:hypothetical protein
MALGPIQQMVYNPDAGMPLQPLLAQRETWQDPSQYDLFLSQGEVIGEYESQWSTRRNGRGGLPSGVKDEATHALPFPFNQGLPEVPARVRNTRRHLGELPHRWNGAFQQGLDMPRYRTLVGSNPSQGAAIEPDPTWGSGPPHQMQCHVAIRPNSMGDE